MTITTRTAAALANTSDGAIVGDRLERWGNTVGFVDVNAGGLNRACIVGHTAGYVWLVSTLDGTTKSFARVTTQSVSSDSVLACTQSSDGKIHIVTYSQSGGTCSYRRFSPTYSGGALVDLGFTSEANFTLPNLGTELHVDIAAAAVGGNEYICIVQSFNSTGSNVESRALLMPVNATSSAAITGINGSGTYTTIVSPGHISGQATNSHDHATMVKQHPTSGALMFFCGFTEAEMPATFDTIWHYFAASNGTNWNTSTLVEEAGTAPYCLAGLTAGGGDIYRARIGDATNRYCRIDKIDSAGTVTQDAFPAFVCSTVGGDYAGWAVLGVNETGTVLCATTYTYWNYLRSGSCTGGTWTLSSEPDVAYALGFAGVGWERGAFGLTASATFFATSNIAGVFDDAPLDTSNSVATTETPAQPTQTGTAFQNVNYISATQAPSAPTQFSIAIEAASPDFVAAGAFGDGTTTVTVPHPAGIVAGDILLADLESANQAVTKSGGGGTWTEVTNSPQGTGTAGGTSATRLTKFWSRYDGSQAAPQFACTGGNHLSGVITAWRGCVPVGNPIHVSTGGVKATSSTTTSIPGSTTTANNCTIVASVSRMDDSNAAHYSAWTNSSLTGVAEAADGGGTTGNGGGIGVAYGKLATAGTYGATTATNATTSTNGYMTVALLGVQAGTARVAYSTQAPAAPTQATSLTQTTSNAVTGQQAPSAPSETETLQSPNAVTAQQSPSSPTETLTLAGSNSVTGVQASSAPIQTGSIGQSYGVSGSQSPSAAIQTGALLQPALVTSAQAPAAPTQATTLAWQAVTASQATSAPTETGIVFQGSNVAASQSPAAPSETEAVSQFAIAGLQSPAAPSETDAVVQPATVSGTQSTTSPSVSGALVQANTVVGNQAPSVATETGTAAQAAAVAGQQSGAAPNETAAVVQGARVSTVEAPQQPAQTEALTQPARVSAAQSPAQPVELTGVLQVYAVVAQQSTLEPYEQTTLQQGSLVAGSQATDEPECGAAISQYSTVFGSQATLEPVENLTLFATSRVDAQCSPSAPSQTATVTTYQLGFVFGTQTTAAPSETCRVAPLTVLVGVRPRNTRARVALRARATVRGI